MVNNKDILNNRKYKNKKILPIFLIFLAVAIIFSSSYFVISQSVETIPNMNKGEKSPEIINIDGTELKVNWERVKTGKFSEERFILDVSQTSSSSTASSTYTINPELLLLETNFDLENFDKNNLEIRAYQYAENSDYYYNYTKTDTCEEITNGTNTSWNYNECNSIGEEIIIDEGRIPYSEGSYCNTGGVSCSSSYSITSYDPSQIGSGSMPIDDSMFNSPEIMNYESGENVEVSKTNLNQLIVPAYDGTKNSHKYFDIKISNLPYKNNGFISTTGTFAVKIGNNIIWDKTHSSWWDNSYDFRRGIENASSNLLLPLNCDGGTSCTSDIDGNANNEVLYGVPSGSTASVYYNNDTDAVTANDTTETFIADTLNNRISGTTPNGLQAFYPFNNNDASDFSGNNNDGTPQNGVTTGATGKINNAFDFEESNGDDVSGIVTSPSS